MERHLDALHITPKEAHCGDSIVVSLSMHVGPAGIPPGAMLVVDCPGYLGHSRPQFLYQEQEGFVSVDLSVPDVPWEGAITNAARSAWVRTREDYGPLVEKKYRPFRWLALTFPKGVPGGADMVIRFGHGAGGFGTGYRVGVVSPRPAFKHRFLLKLFASPDAAVPVEEHALAYEAKAREPASGHVVRHADGRTHVVLRDRFGNPSPVDNLSPFASVERGALNANSHGVFESEDPDIALAPTGAVPLAQCAPMKEVVAGLNLYWGDLHTHSGLSCDCKAVERSEMWPKDMFRFGRDAAALDFMALTDHHFVDRPEQALSELEWEETLRAVEEADDPGRFAAIPGIEYRCVRGDTVVLFGRAPDYETMTQPADDRIDRYWASLAKHDILTMPHFHNPGSLPVGEWIDPGRAAREPAMEVFSCHGRFDVPPYAGMPLVPPQVKALREDRNAAALLKRGLRYGIMCSSDGHKGRPGTNGLVAVFARELTRAAIFDALRDRRCYGTTNARIRLVFTINDRLMGSEISDAHKGAFRVAVSGTCDLRHVDVLKNGALHRRFTPGVAELDEGWDEAFDAGAYYQVNVFQADQEMAFSSPIWVDM